MRPAPAVPRTRPSLRLRDRDRTMARRTTCDLHQREYIPVCFRDADTGGVANPGVGEACRLPHIPVDVSWRTERGAALCDGGVSNLMQKRDQEKFRWQRKAEAVE